MLYNDKKKKSQPKPEFTTTTLNSDRTISTKAIHHNLAPNPELDFEQLQLPKLDPHRLLHLQIERHIPTFLQLILKGTLQAGSILRFPSKRDAKHRGVAVTLVEFWQRPFTQFCVHVPSTYVAATPIVYSNFFVGVSGGYCQVECH